MKCGDCKFWGKNITRRGRPQEDQTGDYRQCGRVIHDEDGSCKNDDEIEMAFFDMDEDSEFGRDQTARFNESIAKPIRKELAVTQDGSGYFAVLKTREAFGCVLFEPSTTKETM